MTEDFHRIRRLPPYVFAEVNAAKAKARAAAEDIVDAHATAYCGEAD
jgi:alanine-synthesizing transaminase